MSEWTPQRIAELQLEWGGVASGYGAGLLNARIRAELKGGR